MALTLIWREGLALGSLKPLQLNTEDLILDAIELVSRSVALSGTKLQGRMPYCHSMISFRQLPRVDRSSLLGSFALSQWLRP